VYELARGCATKLSLWWKGFWETNGFNLQRRSWPGGIRTPLPPELPSGVHAKRKNLVIFCRRGGGGEGGRQPPMTNLPGPPPNYQTRLRRCQCKPKIHGIAQKTYHYCFWKHYWVHYSPALGGIMSDGFQSVPGDVVGASGKTATNNNRVFSNILCSIPLASPWDREPPLPLMLADHSDGSEASMPSPRRRHGGRFHD